MQRFNIGQQVNIVLGHCAPGLYMVTGVVCDDRVFKYRLDVHLDYWWAEDHLKAAIFRPPSVGVYAETPRKAVSVNGDLIFLESLFRPESDLELTLRHIDEKEAYIRGIDYPAPKPFSYQFPLAVGQP